MEFSKKLIVFASVMYALTWAAIVITIFGGGMPVPWRLMESLSWVYGAAVCCYCGKAAYENGMKIKGGEKDER